MRLLPFAIPTLLLTAPLLFCADSPAPELLKAVQEKAIFQKITGRPQLLDKMTATLCREPKQIFGPHEGAEVDVFVSARAAEQFLDPWAKFEPGTVVLKEKRTAEGKISLYTGMKKRESGYFPEGGDWEYFTTDGLGKTLTASGKLQSCAECHARQKDHGFLMRPRYDHGNLQLMNGRIPLHSSKATTPNAKKLRYEPESKKNTLGYWVEPTDYAQWDFSVTKPGKFEVEVLQGCGKGSGGSEVEVRIGTEAVKFTVEDTGHFQNFKPRKIGILSIASQGPAKLIVQPLTKPGGAVMDLRQVTLIPVKE